MIVGLLQSNEAHACPASGLVGTMFFEEVPTEVQAPVVAHITVTSLLESSWKNSGGWFTKQRSFKGLAQVNRAIRGSIEKKLIKIIAPDSSCDSPYAVGDSGFVVGNVQSDENGMLEFHAIAESPYEREKRQKSR